jgi:hypothetical protein
MKLGGETFYERAGLVQEWHLYRYHRQHIDYCGIKNCQCLIPPPCLLTFFMNSSPPYLWSLQRRNKKVVQNLLSEQNVADDFASNTSQIFYIYLQYLLLIFISISAIECLTRRVVNIPRNSFYEVKPQERRLK